MRLVRQPLSTTSYALLGLLAFDGTTSHRLTGYELKQRADRTLRFYWVSPAMSQVYTELDRLAGLGLVLATTEQIGRRTSHRYQITQSGHSALQEWLAGSPAEFPILKHPTALRLLLGALVKPERMLALLNDYLGQLAERREELASVRGMLGGTESLRYPALVADWGLSYYDSEAEIVRRLITKLPSLAPTEGQPDHPASTTPVGSGYTNDMNMTPTDSTSADESSDFVDQDSEATMMAPPEGRPDGVEDESVAETQSGARSQDGDDQTGAESAEDV